MSEIIVAGSINMDIVNHVDQFALPGQTIQGKLTEFFPGGKGANQAVAAAKSGASVRMIGAVGRDPFGEELISSLRQAGVSTDQVVKKEGASGMAFITVNAQGENEIILSQGANGKLTASDIPDLSAYSHVHAVLLQNEIPWPVTRHVILEARRHRIPVIFNPAPAMPVSDDDLALIDTLVLNETEAECIAGESAEPPEKAARFFIGRGVREVLLTLGERGCFYANRDGDEIAVSAYPVQAVDTTAAGDTFIGAFAAARAEGMPVREGLRFASAAAALSVIRRGAQASIPAKAEILRFMNEAGR
ncbi:ribokinase [Paenibacillus thermoaerophilus]|uniref:Ribokinase n=1 Tax=Paenibacillus thermoaerophilus TaxID=1215385 RepID=A0ABW2V7K7_9BACL|nr:ribokinase [Paenibacillus thermoaerophilus]TMV17085.1 ribokinase [Paenibacillus thermoaerophilus]